MPKDGMVSVSANHEKWRGWGVTRVPSSCCTDANVASNTSTILTRLDGARRRASLSRRCEEDAFPIYTTPYPTETQGKHVPPTARNA